MKLKLIIYFTLLNSSIFFGQEQEIKTQITTLLYSQMDYFHQGKLKKFYQFYDKKNYIHIGGGGDKNGKINFRKEKRRMRKAFKKSADNIDFQKSRKLPIDSLLDFKNIIILNYTETLNKFKSVNAYGFTLKEGDYFVLLPPQRGRRTYLWQTWHGGIYRKIKNEWKIVAGDL